MKGMNRISLQDILALRDNCLTDLEIWAVCYEGCQAILSVSNSPEMFQTLCITPDSLAFDAAGNVCFLDLSTGEWKFSYTLHNLGFVLLFGNKIKSKFRD